MSESDDPGEAADIPVAENLVRVAGMISRACQAVGRDPGSVRLLPVSKTHPALLVKEAVAAGCVQFGENRVQEMTAKAQELRQSGETVSWVLIGHLQRNKVRGLMTVAHPDPVLAAAGFEMMGRLQEVLRHRDGGGWDELSMGMSGDFELAIAHGSTCVRIGTAIFGSRARW